MRMTKQLVTVVGALTTLVVLAVGIVAFALPRFADARTTGQQADELARVNQTQQSLIDALSAQAADMAALDAEVADARAAVPETARADDLVEIAAAAATARGGSVTSISAAPAEPFAPRTDTDAAAATPSGSADNGAGEESETDGQDAAPAAPAAPATSSGETGSQQAVTLTLELPDVASAFEAIDEIRTRDRAVAVTSVDVSAADEGVTLTATVLLFFRE